MLENEIKKYMKSTIFIDQDKNKDIFDFKYRYRDVYSNAGGRCTPHFGDFGIKYRSRMIVLSSEIHCFGSSHKPENRKTDLLKKKVWLCCGS